MWLLFKKNNAEIRLVGGCIRDALIEREIKDIDTATTLEPQDILSLLKDNNIEYDDFAIQYGSIIAYPHNRKVQIKEKGSLEDHPYLVNEYDKSNPLKPDQIPNNAREILKWTCSKCGHKWKAALRIRLRPSNKIQKYRNCIKCGYQVGKKKL